MADDVFDTDQGGDTNPLDELVGEGKKFKTVEDLAAGKLNADRHISQIEQENADLKEQLETLTQKDKGDTKVEDLMKAITEAKEKNSEGTQTMTPEELTELVESLLDNRTAAQTKAANRAKGNALVLEKVDGDVDAARSFVAERAAMLGMSPKALAELSETSPDAFAKLIGSDKSTASTGSTTSVPGQRTDAMEGNQPRMEINGYKTKAWFDAKRKELGRVKYLNDQYVQAELARSINNLGQEFNN